MNNIEEAIQLTNRQIDELENQLKTLETKEYVDAFNLAIDVKKLSVEALQEKLEREKGCDYCKNISKQLKGHKGFGYAVLFEQITIDEIVEINIDVDYCPHCGRKLGENNEHVHN